MDPAPLPLSVLTTQQREDVARGLKLAADTPLRSLGLQAIGTWNQFDGPSAKLDLTLHPWDHLTAYAGGTYDRNGPGAEVGMRWEMDW